MPYVLYFGHVNVDITLRVDEFSSQGESRKVKSYEEKMGGTAYNAYMSMKSLGVPVRIFSVVGPRADIGVDGYFVKGDKNPTCWIINSGEEQMAYVYQGLWEVLDSIDVSLPLEDFSWLHFSTGNPRFYLKVAKKANALGKKISFDPSQEIHYVYTPEKFREMLELADIFFCNELEYQRAREYAEDALENKIIVRTEGARGASLHIPGRGWEHVDGENVNVVDTLGAGDTFRAGFYAALYRGYELLEAVKFGNLAASKVVESTDSYYRGTWDDLVAMGKKI